VFESGEGDRVPYYTMPLLRGETLRARIERERILPAAEVRRILLDLADALAYAHDMGVVHRDIKPDNVIVAGQNVLLTDFGVSVALGPSDSTGFAPAGALAGTSGYLAPELAGGGPDLDHRADLYALGVLAYELLTGRRPFEAGSIQELLLAHATEEPVPPEQLQSTVPPALGAIVLRCLAKRPADRYGSAAELRRALDHLTGPALRPGESGARRPSWSRRIGWLAAVAVAGGGLAFAVSELWHHPKPVEGDANIHTASVALLAPEYFQPDSAVSGSVAELVDRISTNLSRLEGLKVVNYLSVGALFRRGQSPTLAEIGKALGVEHLVVFTRIGDTGTERISVQLVEAPTQAQVWVARYSPDSLNLETIDADVVSRVSHTLLGPAARLPLQAHADRARTEGAHGEYLAGKLALRRRTPGALLEAIASFERALELDSNHVEALGRLATALGLQLSYGYRTTLESYPAAARALLLAERAVALDPAHGEPVGFLAYIEYLTLAPLEKVRADFDRAMRLRAAEADVAGWHALMLLREGKTDESLAESRRALELDPLSSVRHLTYALAALGAGRYQLAGSEARSAAEIEPDLRRPRQVEALALLMQKRGAECATMDLAPFLGVKAMCLQSAGRGLEAQELVDSLVRLVRSGVSADPRYAHVVPAQELATYHAWTGNAGEALRYLKIAFALSPVGIDSRILQSGVYDQVRSSPGFQEDLRRMLEAVWPRVLEQRRRLQEAGGTTPLARASGALGMGGGA
jgi:serine/threonine-protein kinase